ncbi:putative zinc-binding protein [Thalassotalea ganghwensis]
MTSSKPVVYACTGCSNVARIAHDIAENLDRDGLAQMSCVAGVVANIEPLNALPLKGSDVIVIDGCDSLCTYRCLTEHGITVDHHYTVTSFNIEKRDMWQDSLLDNSVALNGIYSALAKSGIGF